MIKQDIFKQIRHEIDLFDEGTIHIANGYQFNTKKLINKIILYINSRFESGQKDSRGRRKFFYNIVLFRRDTTKRLIDIDTKDFKVVPKKTLKDQLRALIFESRLKEWMKENNFGEILNQMAEDIATFGTTIIKITPDLIPSVVDIRKIYFEQGAENLQKSSYVIEEHLLTPVELMEKKDEWDNVDELWERWKKGKDEFIKVYERVGIVPENWIKKGGSGKKFIKARFVVADINNVKKGIENGLILYKGKIDEYNYYDFSIRKIKGRLLGVGDVELLLDAQIRRNQIVNQKAVAMEISSKHLFQTQDENIATNFLTDYYDGDIIKGAITPVATENRDLATWKSEEQVWDILADRLTFSFDVVRGESIPATTPATNALIQERQAMSNFKLIRQNFGLFLERIIEKHLFPRLVKQFNEEELVRIIYENIDDIETFDNLLIEQIVEAYKYDYLKKTGFLPEPFQVEDFRQKILSDVKRGGMIRLLKLGKNYFKDFKGNVFINVVNESVDPTTEVINLQNFLVQIASNPQVIQDPILKKFVFKIAERIGISPLDLQKLGQTQQVNLGNFVQQTQEQQRVQQPILQQTQ